jgi:hypothetical protein
MAKFGMKARVLTTGSSHLTSVMVQQEKQAWTMLFFGSMLLVKEDSPRAIF